jgi:hypothetical protein
MTIKPNVTAPPTILKATSNNPTFTVLKDRLGRKFVRLLSNANWILVLLSISGMVTICGIVTL